MQLQHNRTLRRLHNSRRLEKHQLGAKHLADKSAVVTMQKYNSLHHNSFLINVALACNPLDIVSRGHADLNMFKFVAILVRGKG